MAAEKAAAADGDESYMTLVAYLNYGRQEWVSTHSFWDAAAPCRCVDHLRATYSKERRVWKFSVQSCVMQETCVLDSWGRGGEAREGNGQVEVGVL